MSKAMFVGTFIMLASLFGCMPQKQLPVIVEVPANISAPIAKVPNEEVKVFNAEISYQFDNWSFHLPTENWRVSYSSYEPYREVIMIKKNSKATLSYILFIKEIDKPYAGHSNLWADYVYDGLNIAQTSDITINGNSFIRNWFSTKTTKTIGLSMTKESNNTNYNYLLLCSVPIEDENICTQVANSLEIL
jgi:hypothetical protein